MCFFLYLLINAHRFNSPLLHFFFTHTHKHDKAETLSLQICVCVFASPQLVTSGPSSPDRVCTGTSTASDTLPWLATGEFPPCCHARGHFSRVWNYNTNLLNYWITVMQIPVCSRCIIRWHISHFPWFLPAVSSKFWRHWASQWTFPFPRNFPVLLCRLFWDSSLYLSVKFSLSFLSRLLLRKLLQPPPPSCRYLDVSSVTLFTPFIYRYSVYMHFITSRDLFIPSPFFWICISVSHSHC